MNRLGKEGQPTAKIRGAAKVGSSEELKISKGASISGVIDVVSHPKLGIHLKEEAGLDLEFSEQERDAGLLTGIAGLGGAANLTGIKSSVPGIQGTVHLPSVELQSEVDADISSVGLLGAEDVGGVKGSRNLGGITGEVSIPDVELKTTGFLSGLGGKLYAALGISDVSSGINLTGTEKVELGLNTGINVGNVGGIDTELTLQPGLETGLGASITSGLNTPEGSVHLPGLGGAVSVPGIASNVHGISGAVRGPSLEVNAGLSTALGAENMEGVDGSLNLGGNIPGVKLKTTGVLPGLGGKIDAGLGIPDVTGGLGGAISVPGITSNVHGISGAVHVPSLDVNAGLSTPLGAVNVGGVDGSLNLGGIKVEVNNPDVKLSTRGVLPGLGGKFDAALGIPDVSGGINLTGTEKVELGLNTGINVGNIGGIDTELNLQPGLEAGLGASITSGLNTPKGSVNLPGLGGAVSVPGITSNLQGISGAVHVPSLDVNAGLSTALGAVNVGGVGAGFNLGGIRGEVNISSPKHF